MMETKADKYSRFDAGDYLDGTEDAAAYLQIALEESADDRTVVPRALGVIARSQNMSELARRVGMSRDGLYKALSAMATRPGRLCSRSPTPSACASPCTKLHDQRPEAPAPPTKPGTTRRAEINDERCPGCSLRKIWQQLVYFKCARCETIFTPFKMKNGSSQTRV